MAQPTDVAIYDPRRKKWLYTTHGQIRTSTAPKYLTGRRQAESYVLVDMGLSLEDVVFWTREDVTLGRAPVA